MRHNSRHTIFEEGEMDINIFVDALENALYASIPELVGSLLCIGLIYFVTLGMLGYYTIHGPLSISSADKIWTATTIFAAVSPFVLVLYYLWQSLERAFWSSYYPYLLFHGLPVPWPFA